LVEAVDLLSATGIGPDGRLAQKPSPVAGRLDGHVVRVGDQRSPYPRGGFATFVAQSSA
jgi:hypothetical protein